ncbi:MAG TPA: hypothetical protein VF579_14500 [Candidatus Methylomirabilis sp.]
MAVEVGEARPEQRGVISALLDDYLQEVAGHREVAVGATDARSYPVWRFQPHGNPPDCSL